MKYCGVCGNAIADDDFFVLIVVTDLSSSQMSTISPKSMLSLLKRIVNKLRRITKGTLI